MMTIQEAMAVRHSVRAYQDRPLSAEVIQSLNQRIEDLNRQGSLHVQLVCNEPKAFQSTLAKYGKFRNVQNYLVMAGKKAADLDERVGYWGEQLVLFAQTLGLNTCWVGLTYSKVPDTYTLAADEKIVCYIALGYGETQGVSHKIKTVEQVSNASADTPAWFQKGVEAALLAPTAVNQQKFAFEFAGVQNGRPQVRIKRGFSMLGYTKIDLGIAKCHFEVAVGKETFDWI